MVFMLHRGTLLAGWSQATKSSIMNRGRVLSSTILTMYIYRQKGRGWLAALMLAMTIAMSVQVAAAAQSVAVAPNNMMNRELLQDIVTWDQVNSSVDCQGRVKISHLTTSQHLLFFRGERVMFDSGGIHEVGLCPPLHHRRRHDRSPVTGA